MNQQDMISHAWALSEAVEHAVAEGDWTRAAELAEIRSPLLMALHGDQPADALVTIGRIQASIALVMEAAQSAQAALVESHYKYVNQASAASLYHQAAYL